MIRIALCDDEKDQLSKIRQAVQTWADKRNIPANIATFDNGDSLLEYTLTEQTDILFLDIVMPLFNGMNLAHEIRKTDSNIQIIFLTSSPEFAIESYDVKASGYILKPFSYKKIFQVLDDCTESLHHEPENIVVRTSLGYQKIFYQDILYIEAQNKKTFFHLKNNLSLETLYTFSHFADALTLDKGFFRCHRSYIVYIPNVNHFSATEITVSAKGRIVIPISRSHSKDFKDAYFNYMFNKECE